MEEIKKKYGFEVGKVYRLAMGVENEHGTFFPAGVLVKIVSIAPKVRIVNLFPDQDSKEYFYNAVPFHLPKSPRIRANFVTLEKKEVK